MSTSHIRCIEVCAGRGADDQPPVFCQGRERRRKPIFELGDQALAQQRLDLEVAIVSDSSKAVLSLRERGVKTPRAL